MTTIAHPSFIGCDTGGGGTSDHALLSNLGWTTSGHTGTAGSIVAFGAGGAAAEVVGVTGGDLLYFDGTAWVRLAPGTAGQVLQTQGAGAAPVWATAGGGTSDHAALSNLGWTASGHIGTASALAAFDGAGAAAHLFIGVDVQAWDADLDALAALAGVGLVCRTGAGTFAERTISGTAGRITVTDGDGVAGNPTIDIGADVVTDARHAALRDLIHFIDNGPANGFASGAVRDTTYTGAFPTTEVWYESAARSQKIVQLDVTYAGAFPTTEVWRMYDTDGSTVLVTLTDSIAYSGAFESTRTRTWT